ncbi:hypothetical protein JL720_10628 [Aureococcus anophagefferens]|nr:hypothetical protein JL720_10628 [Aureococcus anophagefferens]
MLYASVAKPGSQFAGLTLDQFAQLVERSPQIRTSFESFVADQVPPPPPPPPAPPPLGRRVKLALVVPANIFFFDSDERAKHTVYNWSTRATGGLVDAWEGIKVLRGPKQGLMKALDELWQKHPDVVTAATTASEEDAAYDIFKKSAGSDSEDDVALSPAARRLGLMNEVYDVVIATQMEHLKFAIEHVPARGTSAARHGEKGQKAVVCYGADYAAYGGRTLPVYDVTGAPSLGGQPLTAEICRELHRATGPESDGPTNLFATLISPCAAKGAAIVAELAARCPDVPFLCVSTRWTRDSEAEIQALKRLPNVVFASGVPSERMDAQVWRRTRVLLAPSVWPEPRLGRRRGGAPGHPVLSTNLAGLRESNVTGRVLPCPLLMDIHVQKTACADGRDVVAAFEGLSDGERAALRSGAPVAPFAPATPADVARAAEPFVAALRELTDADGALETAAARALKTALDHVELRQHSLARVLRGLDVARPPWVRRHVDGVGGPDSQPGAAVLAANLAANLAVAG